MHNFNEKILVTGEKYAKHVPGGFFFPGLTFLGTPS